HTGSQDLCLRSRQGAGCWVQRDAHIRLWKTLKQSFIDHSLGTHNRLLCGLSDDHQRTVPGLLAPRHDGLHGKRIEFGGNMTVGPSPFLRMATTPVPPMCSETS